MGSGKWSRKKGYMRFAIEMKLLQNCEKCEEDLSDYMLEVTDMSACWKWGEKVGKL